MDTIATALRNLDVGQPVRHGHLAVFPLLGRADATPPTYWTLREALAAGQARIREVTEGGSVPQLLLENFSDKPILIMDGEEMVGAKQNRCANVTILAPAGQTLVIPVSCVEAGRWSYRSPEFHLPERAHFARGRARKTVAVNASLRAAGVRDARQHEVWDDIAQKAACMNVASPTAAMADIYEQHRVGVESHVTAITAVPGQVGAIFAVGSMIAGLDFFDAEATLRRMLPTLVRSYAIDALEERGPAADGVSEVVAKVFMQAVANARVESYPGVGLGTEIRLTGPSLAAGGLAHEGRIIHLAAFAIPADRQAQPAHDDGFLASVTRRRRVMRH